MRRRLFELSANWTNKRLIWIIPALFVVVMGFYLLAFGRVVVNATSSLPDNAYFMVTWPKLLSHGTIVASELPEVMRAKLGDEEIYLTKRIAGVAGDPVTRDGTWICIAQTCVEADLRDGSPIAPLWKAVVVPAGTVAVLGDSADSLDSRYEVIGAIPVNTIVATGFAVPFPHWTELQEWLQ